MDTLEKARIALRKYLSENKEKVIADFDELRAQSTGKEGIFSYVDNLSQILSIKNIIERLPESDYCGRNTYTLLLKRDEEILSKYIDIKEMI